MCDPVWLYSMDRWECVYESVYMCSEVCMYVFA